MIVISIDVTKIDKSKIFEGKKGKYLKLVLLENREGEDQYGNAGMCVQDTTKEERESGNRGAILGNFKVIGQKPAQQQAPPPMRQQKPPVDPDLDSQEDDVPF